MVNEYEIPTRNGKTARGTMNRDRNNNPTHINLAMENNDS